MVTIDTVTQTGPNRYRIAWSSDQTVSAANPYRIYEDGLLISTQTAAELEVEIPPGEAPVFEILDVAAARPQPGFPATAFLAWRLDTDAARYRIERDVASVWTAQATLDADLSTSFQSWRTPVLDDLSTTSWRVVPIDSAGNDGTPTTFSVFMVRHPDPPAVSMTFNTTPRTVTIAAA